MSSITNKKSDESENILHQRIKILKKNIKKKEIFFLIF
jgi:hypothetical protein